MYLQTKVHGFKSLENFEEEIQKGFVICIAQNNDEIKDESFKT